MKLFDEMPYLENEYLILKEMTMADAPYLQAMTSDPEVYKYLPTYLYDVKYKDPKEVISRMREECFLTKTSIMLGIFQKSDPSVMTGIAEIYGWDEAKNKVSIGIRLAKNYWHQGIGLQTAILLKDYLVNEIKVRTITAHIMQSNTASEKLMEQIGLEKRFSGVWEDWGREGPVLTDKYIYKNPLYAAYDDEDGSEKSLQSTDVGKITFLEGIKRLALVFVRPYSEGAKLVEERRIGCSVAAIILHILCSGVFFFHLVTKTNALLQDLVHWINGGAGEMLQRLADLVLGFLHDSIIPWIGKIPLIGESLQGVSANYADTEIHSLAEAGQNFINDFFRDLANALHLPNWLSFGITVAIVAVIIILLVLLIWAFLKITKHKWCSFKRALCLTAVRSIVTIPFAIVSALLIFINPLWGILLFSFAIFWSMIHVYTAIMAGANKTSGNRGAAWFPPIMILMYILTAAVMVAVIIVVGIVLYRQISDMLQIYIEAVSSFLASIGL